MTILKDLQGNIIDHLDSIGGQTLVDTRQNAYALSALNAELVLACQNTNSAAVDVRGPFTGTMLVEYSINGTDYNNAPIFNPLTELFILGITTVGSYISHLPSGTKFVRVRMSAFTSGSANVVLRGSEGDNFVYAKPIPTTAIVTATGAAGAAVTLTIPSAGAGLFKYFNKIVIERHTSALLTAGATPVIVTTTDLPGSLAFSFPADAAPQGQVNIKELDFTGSPLKSVTAATATTIVCPVTTGVIWRATAYYYIGF